MSDDAYLALLLKIDRQVVDQGADIKAINAVLSDGRITFSEHDHRLTAIERDQAACADRVKLAVREVLVEQRETDRHEKKKPVGETTGLVRAIRRVWPWAKYILLAGLFVGGIIAGMFAGHQDSNIVATKGGSR